MNSRIKKRLLSMILVVLSCIIIFVPECANASTIPSSYNKKIISFKNGDYITITLSEKKETAGKTATQTKTGTKTYYYRNTNNVILWSYSITGTFTYNGSVASCTKVTNSCKINSKYWKNQITSTSRSCNMAIGKITIKQYDLSGTLINTVSQTVRLSCSKTGQLS